MKLRGKLETPAIAATAKLAVGIDRHVAEFARPAGDAPQHPAADDDRAADAEIDLEQDEVVAPDRRAPGHLGDRGAVAFVVGEDRPLERRLEHFADVDARPDRHDARPLNPPVRPDGPRDRDADAEQRAQRQALRRVDFAQGGARGFRRLGGSIVATEREPCFTYDGMRNVGCQQPELVQPQVQADACASLGIERIGRRGPADAAHGFRRRKLDDEAGPP